MKLMIVLIRKLFWIVLFLIFTLVFVTFFEHGWTDGPTFVKDLKTEFAAAKELIPKKSEHKLDKN